MKKNEVYVYLFEKKKFEKILKTIKYIQATKNIKFR